MVERFLQTSPPRLHTPHCAAASFVMLSLPQPRCPNQNNHIEPEDPHQVVSQCDEDDWVRVPERPSLFRTS
jgi:hypothetical protein